MLREHVVHEGAESFRRELVRRDLPLLLPSHPVSVEDSLPEQIGKVITPQRALGVVVELRDQHVLDILGGSRQVHGRVERDVDL